MLIELHAHSSRHSSCSSVDPVTLVKQVIKKGLQGIIITEHRYLWTGEEIEALHREAEIEKHFLLWAGQEVQTDIGHVLVYGADKNITETTGLEDLRKEFPAAALIWAHPFRNGKIPSKEALLNPLLDAIEIFSQNHTPKENYLALEAWHACKFTAIGGSDTHADEDAGVYPTQFDHPVHTMEDIIREIKASRCRPFFKEIPKFGSNMVVTEITIGTKGTDETRNRLILKNISDNKKWEQANKSSIILDTLYDNGFQKGSFRVPKIIYKNENERIIIEEGQRGKNLFELITHVNPSIGSVYFSLAAQWLARLHSTKAVKGSTDETIKKERKRLTSYAHSFKKTGNPHTNSAEQLIAHVQEAEEKILTKNQPSFVMNHGDYHPKNIIIGQDRMHDETTRFISVIDFDSSFLFSRAFDIGYFLSQFKYQLRTYPHILEYCTESSFIEAYTHNTHSIAKELYREIDLFKIRANLSIASFLIKYGKGESQEMDEIISISLTLMYKYS